MKGKIFILLSLLLFINARCPTEDVNIKVNKETLDRIFDEPQDPEKEADKEQADEEVPDNQTLEEDRALKSDTAEPALTYYFQLAQILDGKHPMYQAYNELNQRGDLILTSFVEGDLRKGKGRLNISVWKEYHPVYSITAHAQLKAGPRGVDVRLQTLHEVSKGRSLSGEVRQVHDVSGQEELIPSLTLLHAHGYLIEAMGRDFYRPVPTSYHISRKQLLSKNVSFGNDESQHYSFLSFDNEEFVIERVDQDIGRSSIYKTLDGLEVPWLGGPRLFSARTNDLNLHADDNVYYYEPKVAASLTNDLFQIIVSAADVQTYLQDLDPGTEPREGLFTGLPNVVQAALLYRTPTNLKKQVEDFNPIDGEIEFSVPLREIGAQKRFHIVYLDMQGKDVLSKEFRFQHELRSLSWHFGRP